MKKEVPQATILASVLSLNSNLINHYANHPGLKAEWPISDGGVETEGLQVSCPLWKGKTERPEKYKIFLS